MYVGVSIVKRREGLELCHQYSEEKISNIFRKMTFEAWVKGLKSLTAMDIE